MSDTPSPSPEVADVVVGGLRLVGRGLRVQYDWADIFNGLPSADIPHLLGQALAACTVDSAAAPDAGQRVLARATFRSARHDDTYLEVWPSLRAATGSQWTGADGCGWIVATSATTVEVGVMPAGGASSAQRRAAEAARVLQSWLQTLPSEWALSEDSRIGEIETPVIRLAEAGAGLHGAARRVALSALTRPAVARCAATYALPYPRVVRGAVRAIVRANAETAKTSCGSTAVATRRRSACGNTMDQALAPECLEGAS